MQLDVLLIELEYSRELFIHQLAQFWLELMIRTQEANVYLLHQCQSHVLFLQRIKELSKQEYRCLLVHKALPQLFLHQIHHFPSNLRVDPDDFSFDEKELVFFDLLIKVNELMLSLSPFLKVLKREELLEEVLSLWFSDLLVLDLELDCQNQVEQGYRVLFDSRYQSAVESWQDHLAEELLVYGEFLFLYLWNILAWSVWHICSPSACSKSNTWLIVVALPLVTPWRGTHQLVFIHQHLPRWNQSIFLVLQSFACWLGSQNVWVQLSHYLLKDGIKNVEEHLPGVGDFSYQLWELFEW